MKKDENIKLTLVLSIFVFSIPLWPLLERNLIEKNYLKIVFLDVGQGTSIFVQTPQKRQVLIDAGPGRESSRKLGKYMNFWDKHIDLLIASHPDADHIGAFPEIVKNYDFDYFLKNETLSETSYFTELEKRLVGKRSVDIKMGDVIWIEENIYIQVLFPDVDATEFEANSSSSVFKLVYEKGGGEFTMLFTGDAPIKIENYLVSLFGEELKSDILVVGHHGSKTSSGENFLKAVDPDYSVITVGRDNKHGHPHDVVLERLEKYAGEIMRTDTMGDIKFLVDGEMILIK